MITILTPNRLVLFAAVVLLALSAATFFGGLHLNAHGFEAAGLACGLASRLFPDAWVARTAP